MKVSDYVAAFLRDNGVSKVFGVTGGASIHLLHSISEAYGINTICTHHEQAASMAADGYARATNSFGCAVATSGPGATNLLTGIASAWFDSIPVLHLTGQVATYRMSGSLAVRQYGFQETDFVGMVAGVTKYATTVRDSADVRYELEKALTLMLMGRPGPVVLDFPDDIQRMSVNPDSLRSFWVESPGGSTSLQLAELDAFVDACIQRLTVAERPVVILGAGATSPSSRALLLGFLRRWPMPVLTTWRAKDVLVQDEDLMVGTFGTHGTRAGNFTIQNSDVVLALGTRLSTKETGTPASDFARAAKLLMVDVDAAEIEKFSSLGRPVDLGLADTVENVLSTFISSEVKAAPEAWKQWKHQTRSWRESYAPGDLFYEGHSERLIAPYRFVQILNRHLPRGEHLFVDTGCAVTWIMQALVVGDDVRIHHDCNNTAMGWALPAAIGGSSGLGRPVTCIVGDGSFMMNLQELATARHHDMPLTIFVLNNLGYGMVRQTEEQWLSGKNVGTGLGASGLSFPDFTSLCKSFGIRSTLVLTEQQLDASVRDAYDRRELVVLEVMIDPNAGVAPQCKFGFPIEDADPPLPLEEFIGNMIVPPTQASLARVRPKVSATD